MKEIAKPRGPFGGLEVSPDGKLIAYTAARVDGPTPHDLYVQPVEGGPARNLTGATIDRPIAGHLWRADGSLLVLAATGFRSQLYTILPLGYIAPIPGCDANVAAFTVSAEGVVAFVGETAVDLPELWLAGSKGTAQKVTRLNESWDHITLIKPEILRYKSFDGVEIEGALLKPRGAAESARYSLVSSGEI
jgi:dipeptidyl aminopeptidase/acylaminoacyl peptidase